MNTELNTELNTPTPRTDAAQFWDRSDYHDPSAFDWFVRAEHARTLERELHESRNAERLARVQLGNEREKVQRLVEINEFVGSAQLKAEREKVRVLRAELTNIAAANPAHWGDEMDQFMPWAQNRARHTLAATEDIP
jgi:hypothetical protein